MPLAEKLRNERVTADDWKEFYLAATELVDPEK